jgi:hypothetical protein
MTFMRAVVWFDEVAFRILYPVDGQSTHASFMGYTFVGLVYRKRLQHVINIVCQAIKDMLTFSVIDFIQHVTHGMPNLSSTEDRTSY